MRGRFFTRIHSLFICTVDVSWRGVITRKIFPRRGGLMFAYRECVFRQNKTHFGKGSSISGSRITTCRDLRARVVMRCKNVSAIKAGFRVAVLGGGSGRIDTYLFSFFRSSKSDCFSIRDSNRTMCCRFSSRRSSNRWICRLCDSWMFAMAVRRRATSSNSADICRER